MTTQQLAMIWDHIRQMHGITMRLVDLLPADQLDSRPIPNMRSPKELLAHAYGVNLRSIPEGMLSGRIQEEDETAAASGIRTKEDLVRFCTDCWKAGDRAIAQVTDAQLAATVETPWGGRKLPGSVCVQIIRDELTHHRGQLYCYVRALGAKEVPMMWDFENNAPEYRPKQHAPA
jgi:uncharacterized damage-inducible protein DinB